MSTKGISVLFVCLGNICRSPTADAIAQNLLNNYDFINRIDSAGTSAYHIGEKPHSLMQNIARKHGIEMNNIKSRQVELTDFDEFDYIVAMDEENLSYLMHLCPHNSRAQVVKLLDYCEIGVKNVPDPYYGGNDGFVECYNIIDTGVKKFFNYLAHNV